MDEPDDISDFRAVVLRHQENILRLCAGFLGDTAAEDAAQEVFIKAYRNLDRFEGRSKLSTWLYRIASNHCLDVLSKRKAAREDSLEALVEKRGDSAPGLATAGDFTAGFEDRETVMALLSRLSPDARAILLLREGEGLSYEELAQTLEISLDAVKTRLYRAREALIKEASNI
ncbi:MAG: hypothetical protein A3A86_06735 [Elusimicrobia bacterium RIFCSPLOWO2_01_FULL_60_11]|nr:MAG: hypothetical protein A3A86_06735 [Elusimicrobia bacterium RIFCSPLOWO2_01_FULL_60_11]